MNIKLLKHFSLCIVLSTIFFSNLSYAQQEISLDMRDDCVQLIRPFYGEAYKLFVRGTYGKNDINSLRGYYNHYLETYAKNEFSSLYSVVLQEFHEYTGKTHRLTHDISKLVIDTNQYYPILDQTNYREPRVYGVEREDVKDDAENTRGEHGLNMLCANRLEVDDLKIYSIRSEHVEKYNKQKARGEKQQQNFLYKHAEDYYSSGYHLYHYAKSDLMAQQQELQKHVNHIKSHQDYLNNNDIDLSALITFMTKRIRSLETAIEELGSLGY